MKNFRIPEFSEFQLKEKLAKIHEMFCNVKFLEILNFYKIKNQNPILNFFFYFRERVHTITSPIFAILLDMDLKNIPWLVISISAGSLAISLIGLSGSALILGARRGNILLPILIIPLMTPILIFGVGVNEAIKINASPYGNLFLLLALTLVYLVISPFISALLVRIAIGR